MLISFLPFTQHMKCLWKLLLEFKSCGSQINVLFWRLCIFYGLNELKPYAKNASNWGASSNWTG
jgi:hypothetical protein